MTDRPEGAGQPVSDAQSGVPTPNVGDQGSGGSGSEGSRESVADLIDARFRDLEERLPELVQGRIDSTKDKRFNQLGQFAEDAAELRAYIDKAGGDIEAGLRNKALDELLSERRISPTQAQTHRAAGVGTSVAPGQAMEHTQRVQDTVTRVLSEEGLPSNHPRILEWAKQEFPTVEAMELSLRREAKKILKADNVAPGAVAFEGASTPAASADRRTQYLAELGKLRGSRNAQALMALRQRFPEWEQYQ